MSIAYRTVIVIPCYNEAERLPVGEIQEYLNNSPGFGIHFINDGSSDNTIHILYGIQEKYPELVSVQDLQKNSGKAEAIRQAAIWLLENKNPKYIGFMDADLATPFRSMDELNTTIKNRESIDMIMGARVQLHGSTTIKRYWYRHYFGRVLATFISNLLKLSIYDTQCGAKIISSKVAGELFGEPFTSKWLFDVELIFRLLTIRGYEEIGECLWEVPVSEWIEKGDSKVGMGYLFKVPFELYRIKKRYIGRIPR